MAVLGANTGGASGCGEPSSGASADRDGWCQTGQTILMKSVVDGNETYTCMFHVACFVSCVACCTLSAGDGIALGKRPFWYKFSAISGKFKEPFGISDLPEMDQQLTSFGPALT